MWIAQSECSHSDHQEFAYLRGRGRKLVTIHTESRACQERSLAVCRAGASATPSAQPPKSECEHVTRRRLAAKIRLPQILAIELACVERTAGTLVPRSGLPRLFVHALGRSVRGWRRRERTGAEGCTVVEALRARWCGHAGRALGDASTGRVGGGIEAECKCAWRLTLQPSVLGVGLLVKARWMMLMGTTTVSHVGWFTMQRGRDWGEPVRICSRNATFRVYLVHPKCAT